MCPGDVAAGENHDHQRRADGERCDDPRASADSRAANRQDKKECSNKFGDILVHKSFLLTDRA